MKFAGADIDAMREATHMFDPRKINVFTGDAAPSPALPDPEAQPLSEDLQAPAWMKKRTRKRKPQPEPPEV
jgi:hypothetical protein